MSADNVMATIVLVGCAIGVVLAFVLTSSAQEDADIDAAQQRLMDAEDDFYRSMRGES